MVIIIKYQDGYLWPWNVGQGHWSLISIQDCLLVHQHAHLEDGILSGQRVIIEKRKYKTSPMYHWKVSQIHWWRFFIGYAWWSPYMCHTGRMYVPADALRFHWLTECLTKFLHCYKLW